MGKKALVVAFALLGADCSTSQDRPPGTNRLIHESSPYLLLHAANPVDWFPWGEEAIELARKLDRPIFLSIGYSTCYWCHRMEEDVFEVPEIAAILNAGFVSIKVDREERPDLDEIYMTATQLMTGRGGWPNSVFLTPDLKPFFAGTYFPPEDRPGMVGFPTILGRIDDLWETERAKIEDSAGRIAEGLSGVITSRDDPAGEIPGADVVEASLERLFESFDEEWGGFGGAPKFPSPANLFLLHAKAARGNERALRLLRTTLKRMGEGAIYDHLGGGFHRYATDREWRVPHFEKMLYDNAAIAEVLVETARLTRDPELERLARGTLDFVLEKLTHAEGGFLSAIDAQTDGREGAYYVWSREELENVLEDAELSFLAPILGLDSEPNFEDREYTLYLDGPFSEHASRLGISREELLERLEPVLGKLRRARDERTFPLIDDKVLTDWNGMMIASMSVAGGYFREPRYSRAAAKAAAFLLEELRDGDGRLLHVWRGGDARVEAFLDDYAFLMKGLIALHRETGEAKWLEASERLAEEMEARLRDPKGGYYQTAPRPYLLFQSKTVGDGATASGNGIAVVALLELSELTSKPVYRQRAEAAIRSFAAELTRYPDSARTLALAIDRYHREVEPPLETLAMSVVEARAELVPGSQRFRVVLEFASGWHVNANPASSPYLIPTEVRGGVRDVTYPAGKAMTFSFSDRALSVYDGKVSIEGELGPGVTSLDLVYQACDDTRCLAPVERALELLSR
jgi:hypothetical protein